MKTKINIIFYNLLGIKQKCRIQVIFVSDNCRNNQREEDSNWHEDGTKSAPPPQTVDKYGCYEEQLCIHREVPGLEHALHKKEGL